jgi:hypothetical protein
MVESSVKVYSPGLLLQRSAPATVLQRHIILPGRLEPLWRAA